SNIKGDFPKPAVPIHFSPFGGVAVQFATLTPADGRPKPGPDGQFAGTTPDAPAIKFKISYSTEEFLLDPRAAHAAGDMLLTSPSAAITYTDDVTHDFWFADQTAGGASDGTGSEYVAVNEALMQTATADLKSPVSSCGVTTTPTCNPQFKLG